jgi:predicted negative regulator of RcsB-dependent stress response
MFIALFRFVLILFVLLVFGTQVIWPWWKGTKLFPIFRKKVSEASDNIVEATQKAEIEEMKQRAKSISAASKQKTQTTKKG